MGLRYRLARSAESAGVAEVYLASRKAFLPYAPLAHSDGDVRRWVRDTLVPAGSVTVAADDDAIVGMMATSIDTDACGWIDHLYLAPSCVRRGIGAELLAIALASLPRPVRLHVFEQNLGARRFYERHGFVAIAFGDGSENEEGCPDVLYERVR